MAAHSYWRIRYRYPDTDNTQYGEVYFLDALGTDLCVGGTVIKSSEYNSGTPYFGAANAFDRNTATGYAALGNAGNWIGYHFATPVDVAKIGVTGSAAFPTLNAKGLTFDYSDDGIDWTVAQAYFDTLGNLTAAGYREYDLVPENLDFDGNAHRYWRIVPLVLRNNGVAQSYEEIEFQDAAGVNLIPTGGTASALNTYSTYYPSFAFDLTVDYPWQALNAVNPSWIMWDFGAGNEQVVSKLKIRSYAGTWTPNASWVQYSDDAIDWVVRHQIDEGDWANAETRTYIFADPPTPSISGSFTFAYDVEEPQVEFSFSFAYDVEAAEVEGLWEFTYDVFAPFTSSWSFSYSVDLYFTRDFGYHIEAVSDLYLGYVHVSGAKTAHTASARTNVRTGADVGVASIEEVGAVTQPETIVVDPDVVFSLYHFYSDYYERIWVSPASVRLSNPKIGFEYGFQVWNAYDRPNELIDYTPTDVEGVSFVEFYDMPIEFDAIEFRTLHFVIGSDAPSQITGRMDFTFTRGGDGFDLFALVLGVLRTLPNEPFTEVWSWFTTMEISRNGTEQRQALRDQPRTRASYNVMILDEEDRVSTYQQFYSFASRSVLVPFFQYMTSLDQPVEEGDTRIYFDLSRSDIRVDEYLVFFNASTDQYSIVQVLSLNADGVNLVTPMTFDADPEVFEVLPGRSMRLPNRSSLGMGAVNGGASFKGESTSWRNLLRPSSAIILDTYDGHPILPFKPIAQNDIDEAFDADVEVIDNDSAPPLQRSTYTNPFIESSKEYQIDREEDMDYWRTFFDYSKGMLRPFLLPTWRDDLPIVQPVELGDNEFITDNGDYIDYWEFETYKWVQIASDAGVIYRRVESVAFEDEGLRVSLDASIGFGAGSNENMVVSFLNLTRLNSDEVTLDHFVNWTIVKMKTRTVNQ